MAAATPDPLPIATMLNMVQTKLETSTYLMWRRQVIDMAECFDLMGFLDGSILPPSPTITADDGSVSLNPAFQPWRMKDRKLLSVINTSLTPEAASEIFDCKTSHSAWITLEAAFFDASASHTHALREKLLSLREGDLSVDEYGCKFQNLFVQLSAIGRPLDEDKKSNWFLRGLGLQFASFADTRLALASVPRFRDLLHQAKQFEININGKV